MGNHPEAMKTSKVELSASFCAERTNFRPARTEEMHFGSEGTPAPFIQVWSIAG